jgi:hypothetical protein
MTLRQLSGPEPNEIVAKAKRALATTFLPTRMQSLFGLVELGWYLAALGRTEEACALVDEVTDAIVFTGNFNQWTPVGNAICLSARYAAKTTRKKALLNRLVQHPAVGELGTRKQFRLVLGHSSKLIEAAQATSGVRVACALFAQGL